MSIDTTLKSLGIELPTPPKPVASYVPAVLVGDLLYLSGMLPFRDGQVVITGKLGQEVTVERGAEAARLALLNALAVIKHELGSLDRVQRIVRVVGHVASAEGFAQQPAVINGASEASPVTTIGYQTRSTEKDAFRVIPGIEDWFIQASTEHKMLHELGTVPWSVPAKTVRLSNYHHFRGPAR